MEQDLSQITPGVKGKVVRYLCEHECALRLGDGPEEDVLRDEPLGDLVEVEFRRCRLCQRRTATQTIEAEADDKELPAKSTHGVD